MSPAPNTNGAGITLCSQTQAFLDLGCKVEYVFIRTQDKYRPAPVEYFKEVTYTVLDARDQRPSLIARAAYGIGWPWNLALQHLYPSRNLLMKAIMERIHTDPEAIHVFHYLRTANLIPFLPAVRKVFSNHESESTFHSINCVIEQAGEHRKPNGWETRTLRRLSRLETEVAGSAGLILCVAPEDAQQISEEWPKVNAAYVPLSIPYGETRLVAAEPRQPGLLRLMHVGFLQHLPTFTSLEFILGKVFPLLDANTLLRLQLEVIGGCDTDDRRTRAIMELAEPYPMVRFTGFVDDIRTAYARNDLQVVASTQATGRRTRIVESWAFGTPVLCTTIAAGGVTPLAPGRNILIADDPEHFANHLQELIHNHSRLDEIAVGARKTYDTEFGRLAAAGALRKALNDSFGIQLPPAFTGKEGMKKAFA